MYLEALSSNFEIRDSRDSLFLFRVLRRFSNCNSIFVAGFFFSFPASTPVSASYCKSSSSSLVYFFDSFRPFTRRGSSKILGLLGFGNYLSGCTVISRGLSSSLTIYKFSIRCLIIPRLSLFRMNSSCPSSATYKAIISA